MAHQAEAPVGLVIGGEERPFRGHQVPDVHAIELITVRVFEAADLHLEARVVAEVDVGVEDGDGVVKVLEGELPGDELGGVAFKVDAATGVVEAAGGGNSRRRPPIDHPSELRHPAYTEGELLVLGVQVEAGVVEVVVNLEWDLAEVQV